MSRVANSFAWSFDDLDAMEQSGYAIRRVSVVIENEVLEIAGQDQYGSVEHIAGQQSWRASIEYHEALDSSGDRIEAHAAIEALQLARAAFDVTFTSPTAVTYAGTAWIKSYRVGTSEESAQTLALELAGQGELVKTTPPT